MYEGVGFIQNCSLCECEKNIATKNLWGSGPKLKFFIFYYLTNRTRTNAILEIVVACSTVVRK